MPEAILNTGDVHLTVSHNQKTMTAWKKVDKSADLLWEIDCLTDGVNGGQEVIGGNTPYGEYEVSGIPIFTTINDTEKIWMEYGPVFIPLNPITQLARDEQGIGIHGGGSALGYPTCKNPNQPLVATLGCLRCHNIDLTDKIVPMVNYIRKCGNKIIVSVAD